MSEVWLIAAVWIGLALFAAHIATKLRISTTLSEIVAGTVAQLFIGAFGGLSIWDAMSPPNFKRGSWWLASCQ